MGKLLLLLSISTTVLKIATSGIPVNGYQVIEGGYYPVGIGLGAGGAGIGGAGLGYGGYGGGIGLGGAGIGLAGAGLGAGKLIGGGAGLGGAGLGYGGYGGGIGLGGAGIGLAGAGLGAGKFIGGGAGLIGGGAGLIGGGASLIGAPLLHGYGGEVINRNVYSGGDKKLADGVFEKASGRNGGEFNAGNAGYTKGIAAVKNNKGESGYFNDAVGGKKIAEDGKTYLSGQHFDKQGKQGGEFNEKKGHKKGHVIKGFKNSHHKDETAKTEEFYDEANDEGGKLNFNGQSGSFGEKGASSFKGGLENGEFLENAQKKQ
ncbi:hypothetical protein BDFB_013764, partial [Asbolus verrucosus]